MFKVKVLLKGIKKYLINSKLSFKIIKLKYFFSKKPFLSANLDRRIYDNLMANGCVVIEDYIDTETVSKIVEETKEALKSVQINQYVTTKCHCFSDYGVYRVLECDKISESSKVFFENQMIKDIACAYVDKASTSYQKMIELRPDPLKKSTADDMHFDDWRHRFKAFLYLTDVDVDNAPFVYLNGSHKKGVWRNQREYEYYKFKKEGSYGSFFMREVDTLIKKYGFEKITVTGKSGTLILCDTKGLHSGTPLISGKRILLANYFR